MFLQDFRESIDLVGGDLDAPPCIQAFGNAGNDLANSSGELRRGMPAPERDSLSAKLKGFAEGEDLLLKQ